MDRRVETSVTLREAIPVHIEYWTAWVTPEGILNFRTDLYGRDLQVGRALDEPPPGI